jgi:pyruvate formate lyase activating enzyme
MMKEALLWEKKGKGRVKCVLCYRRCVIAEGKRGFCGVRENRDGRLYTLNYGLASSIAVDPVEKKPLFHFYPGSLVFSLGTVSCNFRCLHCQNYSISQTPIEEARGTLIEYSPEEAVKRAKREGCQGMAWTYNEPTIWFEYTLDSAKLAKEEGLYTVYVTNGSFTREALELISPYLDAVNIDVKAFREDFYREVAKARLAPVLERVEDCVREKMHVELTYLMIPGKNDDMEQVESFVDWVAGLSKDIPVHFTRFHPDYLMLDVPMTPLKTLEQARNIGLQKLHYVYTGNVPGHEGENTYCYSCGELLLRRHGFSVQIAGLTDDNRCRKCGAEIAIVR